MAPRWLILPLLASALAGCWRSDDGAVQIAFIDSPENLFASGVRLSPGAQHLRAATGAGLVSLDAQGDVVPALADRWIVTDDGRSFIFRLRDGTWPDGRELTAESVRTALTDAIRALDGTSLGLDLAPIAEVRAMAGRVIEIRLSSPVPMLLQLLAQPELALVRGVGGSGDMSLDRDDGTAVLAMKPPAARGIPEEQDWRQYVRTLELRAATAAEAIAQFNDDQVDVVLGGRIEALPLAPTGPLSRGTVRLDPALGLFGLQVRRADGLLASAQGREAIAMALDREALVEPFNIGGWVPTTRVVAPGLASDPGHIAERWTERTIEQARAASPPGARRAARRRRASRWRSAPGPASTCCSASSPRSWRRSECGSSACPRGARRTSCWSTGSPAMPSRAGSSTSSIAACARACARARPTRWCAIRSRWPIRGRRPPCWRRPRPS